MNTSFSKYVIHNPSEGTEATIVDTEAEAHEIWTYTLREESGQFSNPVTVYHMTDDCPARYVDGDFLDAAQDEYDNASLAHQRFIRPHHNWSDEGHRVAGGA